MKIFQSVQTYFGILGLGITWPQPNQDDIFNERNSLALLMLSGFTILTNAFILIEAKSFTEYADGFYVASTSTASLLNFMRVIWIKFKLSQFIEEFQDTIQKSMVHLLLNIEPFFITDRTIHIKML